MPEIRNPNSDPPSEPSTPDSAAAVWLKLVGLLVALSAFGLLVFWLSRALRLGF